MHQPSLNRTISWPLLTLYGLGTILGAGIYVLVGEIAGVAGMLAPLSFVVAAVLAALTGLSFAELTSRYPEAAGEAAFVQEGLGRPWLATAVGVAIVFTGVVSSAAIASGFPGYLDRFVQIPHPVASALLVALVGAIAARGIREAVWTAAAITVLEVLGLGLVLVVAGGALADLPARAHELIPADGPGAVGMLLGGFMAFYAYIGFEDLENNAEEVIDPSRAVPRAIVLSLIVATVLYVLVATVCVLTLPPAELAASPAPLAVVFERATGRPPTLISAISVVAVSNGALTQIVMAARVLYGLSRRGLLPEALGRVHPRTRTPLLATAAVTAVVMVLAILFDVGVLAQVTSFVILGVFGLVNLALWRIHGRGPAPEGTFVVPRALPPLGVLGVVAFLAFRVAELVGLLG